MKIQSMLFLHIIVSICLIYPGTKVFSQIDLTGYNIIAAYPFNPTSQYIDTTANNPDATHVNTNISQDGVYLNGIYYGNPDYSHLEMNVQNFDFSNFVISFDYNLTETNHPVLTTVNRWFSLEHWNGNLYLSIILNNNNNPVSQTLSLETNSPLNTFRHIDIQYVDSIKVLKVYLDGTEKINDTLPHPLNFGNDRTFTATHYGYGTNLKGYLKNVIFHADTENLPVNKNGYESTKVYFDNEKKEIAVNNAEGSLIGLYDLSGKVIMQTNITNKNFRRRLPSDRKEIFIVNLINGQKTFSRKIIIN